jgi:hypothetical protein
VRTSVRSRLCGCWCATRGGKVAVPVVPRAAHGFPFESVSSGRASVPGRSLPWLPQVTLCNPHLALCAWGMCVRVRLCIARVCA